jgi:hypothetical protein
MEQLTLFKHLPAEELETRLAERTPEGIRYILMLSVRTGLINELVMQGGDEADQWVRRLVTTFVYYLSDFSITELSYSLLHEEKDEIYSEQYVRSTVLNTVRALRKKLVKLPEIDVEELRSIDLHGFEGSKKITTEAYYINFAEELAAQIELGKTTEEILQFMGVREDEYEKIRLNAGLYDIQLTKLTFNSRELREAALRPFYAALTSYLPKEDVQARADAVEAAAQIDLSIIRALANFFKQENTYVTFSDLFSELGISVSPKLTNFPLMLDILREAGIPCIYIENQYAKERELHYYGVGNAYAADAKELIKQHRNVINKAK